MSLPMSSLFSVRERSVSFRPFLLTITLERDTVCGTGFEIQMIIDDKRDVSILHSNNKGKKPTLLTPGPSSD